MSDDMHTKNEYYKPSVQRLGGVAELTASGSKPGNENAGNLAGTDSNVMG